MEPDWAAAPVKQWVVDIWDVWYFSLFPAAVTRLPPWVTRASAADFC